MRDHFGLQEITSLNADRSTSETIFDYASEYGISDFGLDYTQDASWSSRLTSDLEPLDNNFQFCDNLVIDSSMLLGADCWTTNLNYGISHQFDDSLLSDPYPSSLDEQHTLSVSVPESCSLAWSNTPMSPLSVDDAASFTDAPLGAYTNTLSLSRDEEHIIRAGEMAGQEKHSGQHPQGRSMDTTHVMCTKSGCGKVFADDAGRRRHERTVHMEPSTLKGYRCAYQHCPKLDKIWTRCDHFKSHLIRDHQLRKSSKDLEEMVVKGARSGRGFDARFPFITVDPQ